jgi:hypothetical protein
MRIVSWDRLLAFIGVAGLLAIGPVVLAADTAEKAAGSKMPLLLDENFSAGADRWAPASPEGWKLIDIDGGKAFSEFKNVDIGKKLPHRSPWNVALLKDINVGDFALEVKVRETAHEYPHRDSVLFFGYQDPSHFYYVHFAPVTGDKNADQIFIVNDADRKKITDPEHESLGVHWGEPTDWHRLKVVRKVEDGLVEAYFDDMEKPLMTAHDKNFTWGRIGIGTFDDTADFAEVKLWGNKVTPPKKDAAYPPTEITKAKPSVNDTDVPVLPAAR